MEDDYNNSLNNANNNGGENDVDTNSIQGIM
mgnify:CR=1 FL=1